MNAPFPFGFPPATAMYLGLYLFTLILHVLLMNYVLAGGAVLVAGRVLGRRAAEGPGPTGVLLDWMPFALGAAITAGVAPLLFVQILYKQQFYTANLLLFHRWMAIVPVLIAGFYLLYLAKSRAAAAWPGWASTAVRLGAWLGFAFVAYSWTENHLLGRDHAVWPAFYGSGAMRYRSPEVVPRLALWLTGSIPTMAALVGWQLWFATRATGEPCAPVRARRWSLLALLGLVASGLCGVWYYVAADAAVRAQCAGAMAGPYLNLAVLGVALQTVAWTAQWQRARLEATWLGVASAGSVCTLAGVVVVREATRLSGIDIEALYATHAALAAAGGLPLFGVFLAVNAGLIGWCVLRVSREVRVRGT